MSIRGGATHGVVERVGQIHPAVRALDADPEPPRLRVAEVGAGAHLEILLLARRPRLDVAALDLQIGEVAGAALELCAPGMSMLRNSSTRPLPELLVPLHAVLGLADHDHFLLFKLVDAVHAALLNAVRALLLAETGGVGGQRLRQARPRAGSASMKRPIIECSLVPIR